MITVEPTNQTTTPALAATALVAAYGFMPVLAEVGLVAEAGTVTALVGLPGAGKTTMLRALCGLVTVWQGSVVLAGTDISALSPPERAAFGLRFVPATDAIFRELTVRQNLALVRDRHRASAALDRAVAMFPAMGNRLSSRAGALAADEQQLLALARAIGADPVVVLIDQAARGWAPRSVDELCAALGRISAAGIAVIVVEDPHHAILDVATHVCALDQGRVFFAGRRADLPDLSAPAPSL